LRPRRVELSASILPRQKDATDASWIYESRKYIHPSDCIRSLTKAYGKPVRILAPTIKKWGEFLTKDDFSRQFLMTVYSVVPDFTDSDISTYLSSQQSISLGVALSIETRKLENVLKYGEPADLCLYVEEHNLSDNEIKAISSNTALMKTLYERLLDEKKVMYTKLVANFHRLLQNSRFQIEEKFIENYISRTLSYNKDTAFLEFLLKGYPTVHPFLSKMDSLSWDPYSKSRRYSHWLESINRMKTLSEIYSKNADIQNHCHKANLDYIALFNKFKSEYAVCFM
jgi:hypothetical protein